VKKRGKFLKILAYALTAAALTFAPPGAAMGQLGGLLGGGLIPDVSGTVTRTTGDLDRTVNSTLGAVKRDAVGRPLMERKIDRDPQGARIVRGEILAVSPSDAGLAAAKQLHFDIVRRETLPGLGIDTAELAIPDGVSAADALATLKKADPQGAYDFDHLYDPSGDGVRAATPAVQPAAANTDTILIGMIDGGVDKRHRAFSDAKIISKNVAGPHDGPPTAHGTAVASLLIGEDKDFHGYLPGATLYAADAFGGNSTGGAADDIVRALDWLASNRVAVANISLAGPPNALLQAGVKAFLAHGHVLVAAAGNEGPAAPRAYPASYPGVIAVTSVDEEHRLQVDANRGAVSFAALGVDVRAAAPGRGYATVTGTSYAAPAVAARFALLVPGPDVQIAERACAQLQRAAVPLGKGPRDPATGYGYLNAPSIAAVAEK
jgi:Subtilase family